MYKRLGFVVSAVVVTHVQAASLIPTVAGVSWSYRMTQELGEGVKIPGVQPDDAGRIREDVIYRLDGTEELDNQKVYKFEMHRGGVVTNTDFMMIDDQGIRCVARVDVDGQRTDLKPPQTMVAAPLANDRAWDFDGKAGDVDVHQHYRVVDEEEVTVPAGKFHCFHIYGEQTAPDSMTIDRWFCENIGIIKDVTTTRNKGGDLIRRIELELSAKPKVKVRPATVPPKLLTAGVSSEAVGDFVSDISTETPKIYARWQGHGLRKQARIRAVWIAEDVGDVADPNYTIDEAGAVATAPDARGVFTLSRPEDGWAPGTYRVEFYVDDQPVETVKLKIASPDRFK